MNLLRSKAFFFTNACLAGAFSYAYFQGREKEQSELKPKPNTALASQSKENFYKLKTRNEHIQDLQKKKYDLVIVGGGCNGAGVFLEAVGRGLNCALVESNDFSAATSQKSTKMIHGGIRYLQQVFELSLRTDRLENFMLVKEGLKERTYFVENAFYMNRQFPLIVPTTNIFWAGYYYIGCLVYHLIYFFQVDKETSLRFKKPFIFGRDKMTELFPNLGEKYQYGVGYYDGQFNDARMNVELLLTGTLDNYYGNKGGNIANYAEVKGIIKDQQGRVSGVKVFDKITKKEFEVNANCVVNCTGAWGDDIAKMDNPKVLKRLVPTGGAHLTMPSYFGNKRWGICIPATADGRVLFMLPWLGKMIVGTTECKFDKPVLDPGVTDKEVNFICSELRNLYPNISVDKAKNSILSKWSGLRPLILKQGYDPNSNTKVDTKNVVRNHLIDKTPSGMISLLGGKWTSYRLMGEETVDTVVNYLKENKCLENRKVKESQSKFYRTSGEFNKEKDFNFPSRHDYLAFYSKQLETKYGLDHKTAKNLIKNYGDRSFDILKLTLENPKLKEKIHPELPNIKAEVIYHIRSEMAQTPIDVLYRRTRIGFINRNALIESLPAVVDLFAQENKWSSRQKTDALIENTQTIKKMDY